MKKRPGDIRGFTLLEVLVAMAVLSVALLALASLATQSMKATETGKRLSQAVNVATEKMELLKAIPYANIQSTNGPDLTIDGNLARTCTPTTQATPAVFTCTPTDNTEEPGGDGMVFTWAWTVTYVDLDADTNAYRDASSIQIDTDDIKRIDLSVSWTDIFGAHTTTMKTLRGRI